MTQVPLSLATLALAGLVFSVSAQAAADDKDHHPDDKAAPAAARPNQAGPAATRGMAAMQSMDRQMKAMQDVRARLAAARTPAEREALMAEHSKLMQDGMAMMRDMGQMQGMQGMGSMRGSGDMPADMGGRMQMMEKRMEMMQSMMQMMMDRLPPPAPGKK